MHSRMYLLQENKSYQLCITTNSFFRKKKKKNLNFFTRNENYFVKNIPKDLEDGRVWIGW